MSGDWSPPSVSARHLVRPAVAVTVLGLGAHVLTAIVQIVVARNFGAGAQVDAYFAATALPLYLTTVLTATLPVVFIPVIAARAHGEAEIRAIARGSLIAFGAMTTAVAVAGAAFASPLLRIVAPGLSAPAHSMAVVVAWIAWPALLASVAASLMTGAAHAVRSFTAPAAASFAAGALNLALAVGLTRWWGIYGVAFAATAGGAVQVAILYQFLFVSQRPARARSWMHPAVREIFSHLWPLVVSNLLVRSSVVLERFLASGFHEGAISHVSYASRIAALIAFLLSTGIATVVFPSIADHVASSRFEALSRDFLKALRTMWLGVAPTIAIGIVLAEPAIAVVLQRGRFTESDTVAVATLFRVYLLSLAAATLATLTGRILYALKRSTLLAVAGAIEAAAYVVYTIALVQAVGIVGVAWGFVAFHTLSIAWQAAVVSRNVNLGFRSVSFALARTALAAICGALAAFACARAFDSQLARLLIGGGAGVAIYAMLLAVLNPGDAALVKAAVSQLRRVRKGQ